MLYLFILFIFLEYLNNDISCGVSSKVQVISLRHLLTELTQADNKM